MNEEKKSQLYKKEITLTIVFALLFFVMSYTVFIFVLFPGLKGGYILGFPTHYAVTLFFGWFGMIAATYIYTVVANKFDKEMEEHVGEASEDSSEEGGK